MLTPNALPDAVVRRFADDFHRLSAAGPQDRIGIAVSGGPDSVALLLLAAAAFPGRIEAATVDHKLRAESNDEAMFVAGLCTGRSILHAILTLDGLPRGNVSAAARAARYAALDGWADARGIDWILTAHHADDQVETIIMRLNRGAGVAGLSGVRARHGRVVRPLLGWRRSELAGLCADAGIVPVDDPTNRDDRYDRARLRKSLASADWINPLAVVESAGVLADADAAIEWAVDALEARHVTHQGAVSFDRHATDCPNEILRRLVLRCLRHVDPECAPRGVPLSRLVATLESGGTATISAVIARGGPKWVFRRAPPRRATS